MRRLDRARRGLEENTLPLAGIAAMACFADQAHMTRSFKAAFSMTAGRHRKLRRSTGPAPLELVAHLN